MVRIKTSLRFSFEEKLRCESMAGSFANPKGIAFRSTKEHIVQFGDSLSIPVFFICRGSLLINLFGLICPCGPITTGVTSLTTPSDSANSDCNTDNSTTEAPQSIMRSTTKYKG
eukprot:gnl/TRDRNA2_/TRDRNA2_148512_c3_seq1.p2 gnl/TRDRNA2_/TRDRNA2_148512_c3~~gnl/TRDRNA2_/TRDRNA2_148512_c3_seq1.p2  ORF type:complete len:114 (+),score=2.43 gnl/TRDRNA2_/TRDRNA2_148512_c3_seq1:39-380(+)